MCVARQQGSQSERDGFVEVGWGGGREGVTSEIQRCEKQLSRTDVAKRFKVTSDEIGKGCCRAVGGRLNKNRGGGAGGKGGAHRVKIRAAASAVAAK